MKKNKTEKPAPPPRLTAFDFVFPALDDTTPMPLSVWQGRPLLIVNIASQCGFTPQLAELQTLWERYRERGLVVIGVPSNSFAKQSPLSGGKMMAFCQKNYGVTFPITGTCKVIGLNKHLFYKWAGHWAGFIGSPKWNFHKYLISPEGYMYDWFLPTTSPLASGITEAIETLLTTPTS